MVGFAEKVWQYDAMTRRWDLLAHAVRTRRHQLGLSRDAIHQAGGPSDVVLARIEQDEPPRPRDSTVNKLDGPLEWRVGSARLILAGGEPRAQAELVRPLHLVTTDSLLAEVRRRIPADESQWGDIPHWVEAAPAEDSGVGWDEYGEQDGDFRASQI